MIAICPEVLDIAFGACTGEHVVAVWKGAMPHLKRLFLVTNRTDANLGHVGRPVTFADEHAPSTIQSMRTFVCAASGRYLAHKLGGEEAINRDADRQPKVGVE